MSILASKFVNALISLTFPYLIFVFFSVFWVGAYAFLFGLIYTIPFGAILVICNLILGLKKPLFNSITAHTVLSFVLMYLAAWVALSSMRVVDAVEISVLIACIAALAGFFNGFLNKGLS